MFVKKNLNKLKFFKYIIYMTATPSPTGEDQSVSTPMPNLLEEQSVSDSTPSLRPISTHFPTPNPVEEEQSVSVLTPSPIPTPVEEEQSISVSIPTLISTPIGEEQSVSVSIPIIVEEEQVETSVTQSQIQLINIGIQKKSVIQSVVQSFQQSISNINLVYKSDIANGVRQVDALKIYNSNVLIITNNSITPLIKEGLIRNILQFLVKLATINGKINIGLYNIIAQKYNIHRLLNLK